MHRNSLLRSSLALLASASLLGACGPSTTTPDVTEQGPDAAGDGASDSASPDVSQDAPADTAADATPDVTEDAAMDAAAPDAGTDAATDAPADTGSPDAAGDASCGTVTIDQVQTQVFDTCARTLCHGGSFNAGGLNLSAGNSAAQLVNVHASIAPSQMRVAPGDVANSFLWHKLTNMLPSDGSQGAPMPHGEAILWQELPPAQLDLVRCWIETGAH